MANHFQDTMLTKISKIGNTLIELIEIDLEHLMVKSTLFTVNTYPEAQILVLFPLWPDVFTTQGCRKLGKKMEIHQLTSD